MISPTHTNRGPTRPRPDSALPPGFADGLMILLTGVLALGVSGVVLAMAGFYDPLPVGVMTLAVWVGLVALWGIRDRSPDIVPAELPAREPSGSRRAHQAAVVVLILAVAFGAFNVRYSSQHLRTNRDAGSYNVIGALMARQGDLLFPTREGAFASHPELAHVGFAFYDVRHDTRVYAQFLHMLPAILGVAFWIGGAWLMVKVNAVLGILALLAVYAFATRLMRPWLAVVATSTLGLNFAQVWFTRDSYTEIVSQALLFGGLWALWEARRRWSVRRALVAGALLGAGAMTRVDAFIFVAPLVVYGAIEWLAASFQGPGRPRRLYVLAMASGVLFTAGIGLVDGRAFSPQYLSDLGSQISSLGLFIGAAILGSSALVVLHRPLTSLGHRLWARRRGLALASGLVIVGAAAFAWFVRPHVEYTTGDSIDLVAALQRRDGLAVDASHKYYEFSMVWLAWYTGAVTLAAGVVGLAVLVRRTLAWGRFELLPFLGVFATGAALYIWKPSIVPDQPWAMRRFVPVAIPGFIVLALLTVEILWDLRGRLRLPAQAVALAVAGVGIAFAGHILWPLRGARAEVPGVKVTNAMCDVVDHGAVVVLDPDNLGNSLTQAVRAFCDVPTARGGLEPGVDFYRHLAAEWRTRGRDLYLVHTAREPFGPTHALETTTVIDQQTDYLETTLARRPDRILQSRSQLYVSRVR